MKITVVYGPPCSGKSTYARDALTDESVLYDYDALILAMTNREKHTHLAAGADDAHSDFAAVGDQDFIEHVGPVFDGDYSSTKSG